MTLPNLTSPTAELLAYRTELVQQLIAAKIQMRAAEQLRDHLESLILEVVDELDQREADGRRES